MGQQSKEVRETVTIIRTFFLNFNYVSLACSILLALFIFFTTWVCKFKSTRRLSYRLYFWLSIADVLTHAPLLISYRNSKVNCQIVNFIIFYANVWTVLITSVMALNLHLVFILAKPNLVRSERFYVLGCMGLALLLCTPIAILNGIYPTSCPFYNQFEPPFDVVALYGFFGLFILLPTLYCFYVFVIIAKKLSISKSPSLNSSNSDQEQKQQRIVLKRMVTRLVLYPLVPVFTVFPFLISVSTQDIERSYRIFDAVLQYFAATVQGSINFIFFLFDPALPSLYSEMKSWSKPQPEKENPVSLEGLEICAAKNIPVNRSNELFDCDRPQTPGSMRSSSVSQLNERIELIQPSQYSTNSTNPMANPRLLV